ncbi:MAG: terpene cyclase/mutase family protein [Planctomycetes bacterium]|jgi:hypothetical protein|nr:terpene cyclase/mutase family protein [Planctomycetota bacterium]
MIRQESVRASEFYGSPDGGFQLRLEEALTQAPWWLISVAVHGLVGLVLLMLSFTSYQGEASSALLTEIPEKQDEEQKLDEKLERDVFRDERPVEADEVPIEDPTIKDAEIADHNETDDNEDYESSKGVEDAVSDKPFQGKYWNGSIGIGGGAGGAFGGRFGGRRDLKAGGGSPRTEAAVAAGLTWLKDHQNPDGTWSCRKFMMNCKKGACGGAGASDDYDMGVTGLAMLAFLGAGQTHKHGRHKNTVKNGLKAMKDRQTPDGCFGPKTADGHWIYNHAICTMAAAEAYGLSNRSPALAAMAQKSVDFLLECQNPYLGWRYGRQPGDNDSSVTGWAVLALKSAKIAGLHVPPASFEGALKWFDQATETSYYRTGYSSRGDAGARPIDAQGKFQTSEAMTAAAVASRIFMLGEKSGNRPDVLGGANLLKQSPPRWDVKAGTIDFYYWYYGTLAMYQLGRDHWKAWNDPMKNALVPTQRREGCEDGSWDPVDVWGTAGGRVYATAINILSLEIYYRFSRLLRDR